MVHLGQAVPGDTADRATILWGGINLILKGVTISPFVFLRPSLVTRSKMNSKNKIFRPLAVHQTTVVITRLICDGDVWCLDLEKGSLVHPFISILGCAISQSLAQTQADNQLLHSQSHPTHLVSFNILGLLQHTLSHPTHLVLSNSQSYTIHLVPSNRLSIIQHSVSFNTLGLILNIWSHPRQSVSSKILDLIQHT